MMSPDFGEVPGLPSLAHFLFVCSLLLLGQVYTLDGPVIPRLVAANSTYRYLLWGCCVCCNSFRAELDNFQMYDTMVGKWERFYPPRFEPKAWNGKSRASDMLRLCRYGNLSNTLL